MPAVPDPIKVDIWSDVACPWCYIGKRTFEAGAASFAEGVHAPPVEVEYHSYELLPGTPTEFDGTAADFLARAKGLPMAQVRQMHDQVTGIARGVGLRYDFGSQQPTSTRKAHQVIHLAKAHGVQSEVKERLFRAHFVEGRHVGRDEELADLAAEVGLDRREVLRVLRDETYLPAVRADIDLAAQLGISAVPFFVVDGRVGIPGAQQPETFVRALEQVRADPGKGSVA